MFYDSVNVVQFSALDEVSVVWCRKKDKAQSSAFDDTLARQQRSSPIQLSFVRANEQLSLQHGNENIG
jgi:hypothetical protein